MVEVAVRQVAFTLREEKWKVKMRDCRFCSCRRWGPLKLSLNKKLGPTQLRAQATCGCNNEILHSNEPHFLTRISEFEIPTLKIVVEY